MGVAATVFVNAMAPDGSRAGASNGFPPTDTAVVERLDAISPGAYARTRNHLEGAVTRLSPYLTHGFLTLRDVAAHQARRGQLPVGHKLIYELGWRAWFRHAWRQRGDGIFDSLHEGPLADRAYSRALPDDLRAARTGIPVIDRSVETLYRSGWLHNHARMWLASYLIHVRKTHWRTGADWMIAHLLDGDLASNHLSWQWVAGTGSSKPYLFNADNVARYAPADWRAEGSILDTDYASLDRLARTPAEPVRTGRAAESGALSLEPPTFSCPPDPTAVQQETTLPSAAGRQIWLVHPWNLRIAPPEFQEDAIRIGVLDARFHARWPWSRSRWRFVLARMTALTDRIWWIEDREHLADALGGARSVASDPDPHLGDLLDGIARLVPERPLFLEPTRRCRSFSDYWRSATRDTASLEDLLARHS